MYDRADLPLLVAFEVAKWHLLQTYTMSILYFLVWLLYTTYEFQITHYITTFVLIY
jgi:hypothetical protein